jgi:hypothetical protein
MHEVIMAIESGFDHNTFTQMVKASLRSAENRTASLRTTNTRLLVAGIVSSTVTTLVAGGTAAMGSVVSLPDQGWRIACIVAAGLAFISTLSTGLAQQLRLGDRASQGNQCVGRLRALDVALATGNHTWEENAKEYEEITRIYPELIGP